MSRSEGHLKLVAILSAFDESPHWLATVCAGAGRFCDALIYADGGYELFPGARPRSMPEQAEAVVSACEGADIELLMLRPKDIWHGNEVEKRNATVRLARAIEADWVVVLDADMHVMKANAASIRWDLEKTEHDVATMTVLEGADFLKLSEQQGEEYMRTVSHEWTTRQRLVYRMTPGLRYGPAHWHVKNENGTLWGPSGEQLPAAQLEAALVVYHRSNMRMEERMLAAQLYYETRDRLAIERRAV